MDGRAVVDAGLPLHRRASAGPKPSAAGRLIAVAVDVGRCVGLGRGRVRLVALRAAFLASPADFPADFVSKLPYFCLRHPNVRRFGSKGNPSSGRWLGSVWGKGRLCGRAFGIGLCSCLTTWWGCLGRTKFTFRRPTTRFCTRRSGKGWGLIG